MHEDPDEEHDCGAPEKEPEGILYLLFYPARRLGVCAALLFRHFRAVGGIPPQRFAQKGEGSRKEKSEHRENQSHHRERAVVVAWLRDMDRILRGIRIVFDPDGCARRESFGRVVEPAPVARPVDHIRVIHLAGVWIPVTGGGVFMRAGHHRGDVNPLDMPELREKMGRFLYRGRKGR